MEELNLLLLPDLDTAEVIDLKDMRFKVFAHIEYVRKKDNTLLRVCKPFGDFPIFYIPIDSLEREYARDLEVIRKNQRTLFPKMDSGIHADEDIDHHWTNENCFTTVKHEE